MPPLSYASAERFLLSREFFGMKLGLENISEFLESIGSPQFGFLTIHIAGTNGKGSTASMLASILQAQGYKTGLYTSPHLVSLRERVRIDDTDIPKTAVTAYVRRHRRELIRRKLSFFEVMTAMAFEHFSRSGVEVAVIETGLGGRLDATNVMRPLLTIVTDISRDHMEILGGTLRRIAIEKAGIIKSGVPHLIGLLPDEARKVMVDGCRKIDAPLHRLSRREYAAYPSENRVDFRDNLWGVRGVRPGLLGPHQLKNAALVFKAVGLLRTQGLPISRKAALEGMADVRWPGRFQVLRVPNQPTLVFDVGHNAGGVAAFAETFRTCFPGQRAHILTGFVKKKEHQKMFDQLAGIAAEYVIVPLATRRSVDTQELIRTIRWRGVPVHRHGTILTGWRRLTESCGPDDIICVIGSHYLVGEFFQKIGT